MVRSVKERGRYEYTRKYTDLAGVELGGSGSTINGSRLAYLENMYRDYEGDGGGLIESVPGYRRVCNLGAPVSAIYPMKGETRDYVIARAGKNIYRIAVDERDSVTDPEPLIEMQGEKSAVFPYGKALYLTDVNRIVRIGEDGGAEVVNDEMTYVPTVRLNGAAFEEKNLLTRRAKEEFVLADPSNYSWGHPALRYKILDRDKETCAVSGVYYSPTGVVQVPSTVMLGGKRYRVKEIMRKAFSTCIRITEVYIAEGVERIDTLAFSYCKGLTRVVTPSTIADIGNAAFTECDNLTDLYLGAGIKNIGIGPFAGTVTTVNVHYAGSLENLADVSGVENLDGHTIITESENRKTSIECPISERCTEVLGATLGGEPIEWIANMDGDRVSSVTLTSDKFYDAECDIAIDVRLAEESFTVDTERRIGDIASFIGGMTVAEAFDGRIFLSGNSAYPNTIIYSARAKSGSDNAIYFGSSSYMNDGVGGYPVVAMLAVRDSLAVFKSGDDGTGSIFYHTAKETGDAYMPKIYPVEYVHSGIGAIGGAVSFLDDPVFLSRGGLMALTQKAINYERSVSHRSHNVNLDLLKQDLTHASMTEWLGYLVIGAGDTAYLADSRALFKHQSGSYEYEWFMLRGIGEYKNSTRVYRYDSYERGEYHKSDKEGEVAEGVVYNVEKDGEMLWYVIEDGVKRTVYPTREMLGGEFYPATAYLGIGELLFFGTGGGGLFVFNNDKRGVAPKSLSEKSDFDPEEYKKEMGRALHPEFYSFDNHAPRYAIKTASDSCGIPHLAKSTIRHSLVMKYKAFTSSEIRAEVLTDKGSYKEICLSPATSLAFDELNFESLALTSLDYNTLPISEKEKNWVEKQITIYSDKFESPIGIYSIVYRYTVKGRIKNS